MKERDAAISDAEDRAVDGEPGDEKRDRGGEAAGGELGEELSSTAGMEEEEGGAESGVLLLGEC